MICDEGTERRGTTPLIHTLSARWGGWSTTRRGRFTLGKETRYPGAYL